MLDPRSDVTIDCERCEVERAPGDVATGFRQLTASGNVRFQGRFGDARALDIGGEGEILVLDGERRGNLEAGPNERVTLIGRSQEELPFRLTAERVDFEVGEQDELRLFAQRPELRTLGLRARAEHFTADDQRGVVLSGGVRAYGATAAQVPYTLDADEIVLVGRRAGAAAEASAEDQLDSLTASGAVDFRLSDGLRARGERLSVKRSTGLLRLEGAPASFEFGGARLETEWVEFDPVMQMLVATGRGRMQAQPQVLGALMQSAADEWSVDFLSASTRLELDSIVLAIQEPVFHTGQFQTALRASWAVLWLNRAAFEDAAHRDALVAGLQDTFKNLKDLKERPGITEVLSLCRSAQLAGLLREIYFEGPVEILSEGQLLARADAIYLDATQQRGWLARATVNLGGQFTGQRVEKLIVKADWLRLDSNGELRADRATVTSCDFDHPHMSVVTGDLRITPIAEPGKAHYHIRMEDNRVELYDTFVIPLPTIDFATDEELQPILPTLSLANSARFGTLLGFAFTRPADAVGHFFDRAVRWFGGGGEEEAPKTETPPTPGAPGAETPAPGAQTAGAPKPRSKVNAHYKVDGSYLGSRGGLLDLGLEIEKKQSYWFDLYLGLAADTGEDKGFVRVPEEDRDSVRRWLRSQAYFDRGKNAITFSYSDQSDAGVQSEYYESQFVRYERAETYLQWRRSDDVNFIQGTVKVRADGFRTDIEELPSFSGYRGRSPLLTIGGLTLLHTGDARVEYLRRREGSEPQSPFALPTTFDDTPDHGFGALDGLGNREVVRADTSQSLELPVPLGAGWKLTPFVSGRATAWSEGGGRGRPALTPAGRGRRAPGRVLLEAHGERQAAPVRALRRVPRRARARGRPGRSGRVRRARPAGHGRFRALRDARALRRDGESSLLDVDLSGPTPAVARTA
jgi:hypothetical protein